MSEPLPPAPSVVQVRSHLQTIARLLRHVHHLGPEAQELLAELVDELDRALAAETVPSAEVAHLTECTAHLITAAQQDDKPGLLGKARARLDRAVLAAESEAPLVAGLARRLVDALANLGI